MEDGLGRADGRFQVTLTSKIRKDGLMQMISTVRSSDQEASLTLLGGESGLVSPLGRPETMARKSGEDLSLSSQSTNFPLIV